MSKYQIEKGVDKKRRVRNVVYPFTQMEIGDSFLIPVEEVGTNIMFRNFVYSKALLAGCRCSCELQEDGSMRVWKKPLFDDDQQEAA